MLFPLGPSGVRDKSMTTPCLAHLPTGARIGKTQKETSAHKLRFLFRKLGVSPADGAYYVNWSQYT